MVVVVVVVITVVDAHGFSAQNKMWCGALCHLMPNVTGVPHNKKCRVQLLLEHIVYDVVHVPYRID